jgi:NitT/TauT family transport system ATP-binding protein
MEMQDLLAGLWRDGDLNTTFVFVTHDIEEAIFLADKIVVLSRGPGTILAELEAPPPSAVTREGLSSGRFRMLEEQIIKLIYGEVDDAAAPRAAQRLLGDE